MRVMLTMLINVLSFIYGVLHHGVPISRTPIGTPKKEIFTFENESYEIESSNVKYMMPSRVQWLPKSVAYGVVVKGIRITPFNRNEIGVREYPLLVPSFMKNTALAHVVARRQFIMDLDEIMNTVHGPSEEEQ